MSVNIVNVGQRKLTRNGSIVSYKSSQVQLLVVDMEVLQTADKLPAAEGKVIGSVGNSTQKQWAGQIQRPEKWDKEVVSKQTEGLVIISQGWIEEAPAWGMKTIKAV